MDLDFDLCINGAVEQARNEIKSAGYEQLATSDEVDRIFKQNDAMLVIINSVCGCTGGIAHPAASHALHYDKLPNGLATVSAGQDKEAIQQAREYFEGHTPSSPSLTLMRGGKITEMIEHHQIEGHDIMGVIDQLQKLFDKCYEKR